MLKKNKSTEIVKILIENDKQKFFLNTDVWEDPAAWGLLLVDLAKHIANSYSQSYKLDKQEVLRRIREGFDIEWKSPTEEV
jgi:hypothetical protein